MDLRDLQQQWNRFGETDPYWAVLTHSGKAGGLWNRDEFFATGRAEIAAALAELQSLKICVQRGRALDFGSGLGRLSQALAGHFEHVDGVDIAPAMVEQARALNSFGERCTYHLNSRPNLSLFATGHFDFIYSKITLQHMKPSYAMAYVAEFVRVLKPGGVMVFQVPERPRGLRLRLYCAIPGKARRLAMRLLHPSKPIMEMYGTPRHTVAKVLRDAGGEVYHIRADDGGGPDWPGARYVAGKAVQPGTSE